MICRLRVVFRYSWDEVLFDVPMDRCFAEMAWAIENDMVTRAFGGIKRSGKGYIGMETERLMDMLK